MILYKHISEVTKSSGDLNQLWNDQFLYSNLNCWFKTNLKSMNNQFLTFNQKFWDNISSCLLFSDIQKALAFFYWSSIQSFISKFGFRVKWIKFLFKKYNFNVKYGIFLEIHVSLFFFIFWKEYPFCIRSVHKSY
jgi:hypothetical protein